MRTRLIRIGLAMVASMLSGIAMAADYPARVVEIVTPAGPGSSLDVLARLVSERLAARWGVPVTVKNQVGAGGLIAANTVSRAKPDGYTILFTQAGALTISPALDGIADYDALKKFAPITQVCTLAVSLSVNAAVPARNLNELVALARSKPGELRYASVSNQYGLPYLYSVLFSNMAKIKMLFVPYTSSSQSRVDLLSGRIDLMFDAVMSQYPYVKAGKIRPLAIFANHRSQLLPEVPTAAEQGFDLISGEGWYGLLAPAGTPAAVTDSIGKTVAEILKEEKVRHSIGQLDMHITGVAGDAFAKVIQADTARWAKVIREDKIAK
ncbi:Bug family tripartite tricarboxylate transporter substrate binding protein [Cupriavidus nantongensis]|uniref:Bug family tripartite tricarboxylate transporter substrate binding protein n=1 Tax=Cupriavidus nantongensis TaxID=1796606 RepID=UPI00358DF9E3